MKKNYFIIFIITIITIFLSTSNVYARTGSGTEANPYNISIGETNIITGSANNAKDKIYNKFTITETKTMVFSILEPNTLNTLTTGIIGYVTEVYDTNNNHYYYTTGFFGENKKTSNGKSVFTFMLNLKPGTYYFVFQPNFTATSFYYYYTIDETEFDFNMEEEYNNTKEDANPLNETISGLMQPIEVAGTDEDFFYFNLEEGTKTEIKIKTTPLITAPRYYPIVHLFTPNKKLTDIIYTIDSSSTDSKLKCNKDTRECTYTFIAPTSGKYYIEVTNGASSQVIYSINVTTLGKPFNDFTLNETRGTIYVGDKKEIQYTINPENTTDDLNISFESSNTDVAVVDQNGIVTALKSGTSTITVKINDKTKRYYLTVKDIEIESVSLDKEFANMKIGDTLKLNLTINPSNYTEESYLYWRSDNTRVATVDQNGNVTAKKPGTAIITISGNGTSASCEITVDQIEINSITLDKENANLNIGDTLKLNPTIYPSNYTINLNSNWESSNPEVATVDQNGKITAKKPGTATITISSNGKSASCEITVNHIGINSITLDKDTTNMYVGENIKLNPTINPNNYTIDSNLNWESSKPEVATVDQEGNITAISQGTATITVRTSNNKEATCQVYVSQAYITVREIRLNKTTLSLLEGSSDIIIANITPTTATDKKINWTSNNPNVVTVNNNGEISAIKEGTAVITATASNGKSAACEVTVTTKTQNKEDDDIPVYRMYNPINGEHLFTFNKQEVEVLYKYQGWGFEGIGWFTSKTGTPVYRLYSPKFNNHLYTSNMAEITLITTQQGWIYDFDQKPVMYSYGDVSIYRLYNPSLSDQHHLTTSYHEYTIATQWGWRQEGVAMQATSLGVPVTTYYYKDSHKDLDLVNINNNVLK